MLEKTYIRDGNPEDDAALAQLYAASFPDEDLVPLVRELQRDEATVVSRVAVLGDQLLGHVFFSSCHIEPGNQKAALLGPLAVSPEWQRRGLGSRLVRDGLDLARSAGASVVCVLGDPNYYGRLGFTPERSVQPPYTLPDAWRDAWQSVRFGDQPIEGTLAVSPPWRHPKYWAP